MTPTLHDHILSRLTSTGADQHPWSLLILAALDGPQALADYLGGSRAITMVGLQGLRPRRLNCSTNGSMASRYGCPAKRDLDIRSDRPRHGAFAIVDAHQQFSMAVRRTEQRLAVVGLQRKHYPEALVVVVPPGNGLQRFDAAKLVDDGAAHETARLTGSVLRAQERFPVGGNHARALVRIDVDDHDGVTGAGGLVDEPAASRRRSAGCATAQTVPTPESTSGVNHVARSL